MGVGIMRHKVKDFAAWKQAYDADAPRRAAASITSARVCRLADDPNDVVVIAEFEDAGKLQDFLASPDLHALMEQAGVLEPPSVLIMTEAD